MNSGDFQTSQLPKFCLTIFGIKFKSSNKILVQGGWFAEFKASEPARRLAEPISVTYL